MADYWKLAQDLVQVPRTDLCGSARRLGLFRQPDNVFSHRISLYYPWFAGPIVLKYYYTIIK